MMYARFPKADAVTVAKRLIAITMAQREPEMIKMIFAPPALTGANRVELNLFRRPIPPNMPTDPARREAADLPIEHPTMFDPVTSLITAKRLV